MVESIKVAKICSVVLDEYISATQQVLSLFKSVLYRILIAHVKSSEV